MTVRTTTHANPIPGTSRYSRFIVLTCLLCRLPVYRVFQTISLGVQGKESILLPTDDWVEREILKSATGWIQVHKDTIVSITQQSYKSLTVWIRVNVFCFDICLYPRGEAAPFVHFRPTLDRHSLTYV